MKMNNDEHTVLEVTSLQVLDEDRGEMSLLLHHGKSVDLHFSTRTLPRVIMALFSLASAMEDRSYALKKERRIFALGIRDVGVHVIGSGAGRQAVVSFEFGNGAVFRFLLDQPLFRKLSGVFDREFSQGLH